MVHLMILGTLRSDAARSDEHRALALDEADLEWTEGTPLFTGESPAGHATVGDVLDAMERAFAADPGSVSFFERDGGWVSGWLTPEHTAAFHQDLATALRLAAQVGGEGQVSFFVPAERVVLVMPIGEEAEAPFWQPAAGVLQQDEALSVRVLDAHAWFEAKQKDPSLTRAAFAAASRSFGVGPMDATHEALLRALAAADRDAVQVAVSKGKSPRMEPLEQRWPDAAATGRAIAGAEPLVRVVGIQLLAAVAPAKAEPLAVALLTDPSEHVRRSATTALGMMDTASAVDQLFALLAHETLGPWAVEALVASPAAAASTRIVATLDAPPLTPQGWSELARGSAERVAAAAKATWLLQIAGKRKVEGIAPRLWSLYESHPAEEVRKEAARALVFTGDASVKPREQELMFTLMDMGRALNDDDTRRRELLRITEPDDGGILKFDGLDLERLETLLREHLASPGAQQNDSPTIDVFRSFMKDHPAITAHGYAVSRKRADYRVSVEGVAVALADVPEEKQDAVRALFDLLGKNATNSELEGDDLYVWWT